MIRAVSLASAVVVAACGGSAKKPAPEPVANVAPAPPPTPAPPMSETDQAFAAMERFERDMCACAPKDSSCAKTVNDALMKWSQDMQAKRTDKEPMRMTEDQLDRATKLGTHMGECMQAVMSQ